MDVTHITNLKFQVMWPCLVKTLTMANFSLIPGPNVSMFLADMILSSQGSMFRRPQVPKTGNIEPWEPRFAPSSCMPAKNYLHPVGATKGFFCLLFLKFDPSGPELWGKMSKLVPQISEFIQNLTFVSEFLMNEPTSAINTHLNDYVGPSTTFFWALRCSERRYFSSAMYFSTKRPV